MDSEIAIAAVFVIIGFLLGRKTIGGRSETSDFKATAYKELLAAFNDAYSILLIASLEEHITHETKEAAWKAFNALSRAFECTRFIFSEAVSDTMVELLYCVGAPWNQERLEMLKRARDSIHAAARKDFKGGA